MSTLSWFRFQVSPQTLLFYFFGVVFALASLFLIGRADDNNNLNDFDEFTGEYLGPAADILEGGDRFDIDGDGVGNLDEFVFGTNAFLANTDGDLYDDGEEVYLLGTDPNDPSDPDTESSMDSPSPDSEGENTETGNSSSPPGSSIAGINPGQNLPLASEYHPDFSWDRDGDGVSNVDEELLYLTDPDNPDSDGDGSTDGQELSAQTDPLSAVSFDPDSQGLPVAEFGTLSCSQSDPDHWYSLSFQHSYINPVAIFGALTMNGGDPASVKIRNLDPQSLEYQIAEFEYLDGRHGAKEDLFYLVVEGGFSGGLRLPDGTRIQSGEVLADEEMFRFSFPDSFEAAPLVFAQVVGPTESGRLGWARLADVDESGFSLLVTGQEQGRDVGRAAVRWIAIEKKSGANGGVPRHALETSAKQQWKAVASPVVGGESIDLASMQTYAGSDPAVVRIRKESGGLSVKVQEGKSADRETGHALETIGILALEKAGSWFVNDGDGDGLPDYWEIEQGLDPRNPDDAAYDLDRDGRFELTEFRQGTDSRNHDSRAEGQGPVYEAGTIEFDQPDPEKWRTVVIIGEFTDPVVILGAPTHRGGDSTIGSIRNVTATSFELQLQEFLPHDGKHTTESISYLVVEKGRHVLEDGTVIEAGVNQVGAGWQTIAIVPEGETPGQPLVFATSRSAGDPAGVYEATAIRMRNVSPGSFQMRLQGPEIDESAGGATDAVNWISWTPPTGASSGTIGYGAWESALLTTEKGKNKVSRHDYGAPFLDTPALFSQITTWNGSDPAWTRVKTNQLTQAEVFVEEDRSVDNEENHVSESVCLLALDPGVYYAFAPQEETVDPDPGNGTPDPVPPPPAVTSHAQLLTYDGDGDGVPGILERVHGFSDEDGGDLSGDFDLDGLSDKKEILFGTDWKLYDTDSDGLSDKEELDGRVMVGLYSFEQTQGYMVEIRFVESQDEIETIYFDYDGQFIDYDPNLAIPGGINGGEELIQWLVGYHFTYEELDFYGVNTIYISNQYHRDDDEFSALYIEVRGDPPVYTSSPTEADTDNDGYTDLWELDHGLNPRDPNDTTGWSEDFGDWNGLDSFGDADGDGIENESEFYFKTDPFDDDTDNDGRLDGEEVGSVLVSVESGYEETYTWYDYDWETGEEIEYTETNWIYETTEQQILSDPTLADSNFDGISDADAIAVGSDPMLVTGIDWTIDVDGDGLDLETELALGTSDTEVDSDQDGWTDWEEVNVINPILEDLGFPLADPSDPSDGKADWDGDGIENGEEFAIWGTDFLNPDTDFDGYDDFWELYNGSDPFNPLDPDFPDDANSIPAPGNENGFGFRIGGTMTGLAGTGQSQWASITADLLFNNNPEGVDVSSGISGIDELAFDFEITTEEIDWLENACLLLDLPYMRVTGNGYNRLGEVFPIDHIVSVLGDLGNQVGGWIGIPEFATSPYHIHLHGGSDELWNDHVETQTRNWAEVALFTNRPVMIKKYDGTKDVVERLVGPKMPAVVTTDPKHAGYRLFDLLPVNLCVDSNNDGNLTEEDKFHEDVPSEAGSIDKMGVHLQVNDFDYDADKVPDYVDGITVDGEFLTQEGGIGIGGGDLPRRFSRLHIITPAFLRTNDWEYRFEYSADDPAATMVTKGPTFGEKAKVGGAVEDFQISQPTGNLRIWTKDANETRAAESLNNETKPGDFVPANKWIPGDTLFTTGSGNGNVLELYLEGIKSSTSWGGDKIILKVRYRDSNAIATLDAVSFTVTKSVLRTVVYRPYYRDKTKASGHERPQVKWDYSSPRKISDQFFDIYLMDRDDEQYSRERYDWYGHGLWRATYFGPAEPVIPKTSIGEFWSHKSSGTADRDKSATALKEGTLFWLSEPGNALTGEPSSYKEYQHPLSPLIKTPHGEEMKIAAWHDFAVHPKRLKLICQYPKIHNFSKYGLDIDATEGGCATYVGRTFQHGKLDEEKLWQFKEHLKSVHKANNEYPVVTIPTLKWAGLLLKPEAEREAAALRLAKEEFRNKNETGTWGAFTPSRSLNYHDPSLLAEWMDNLRKNKKRTSTIYIKPPKPNIPNQ